MKRTILTTAALVLFMACEPQTPSAGPVAETSPAPASLDSLLTGTGSIALIATTPAEAPPLTFTRRVDEAAAAEGMDPVATVRLEAGPEQYLELTEANHTPFDLTAQAADGPLASAIGAPAGTSPLFLRIGASAGTPLICAPDGPSSLALHETAGGELVMTGLTITAFEGEETASGVMLAPLPVGAICGRTVYSRARG